jgi:hypothetical protein
MRWGDFYYPPPSLPPSYIPKKTTKYNFMRWGDFYYPPPPPSLLHISQKTTKYNFKTDLVW